MQATLSPTGAALAAASDDGDAVHKSAQETPHEPACLRPLCCNPFAAFSAFSRVGGWTPPLPETSTVDDAPGNA